MVWLKNIRRVDTRCHLLTPSPTRFLFFKVSTYDPVVCLLLSLVLSSPLFFPSAVSPNFLFLSFLRQMATMCLDLLESFSCWMFFFLFLSPPLPKYCSVCNLICFSVIFVKFILLYFLLLIQTQYGIDCIYVRLFLRDISNSIFKN